ncbi:hypothetical protein CDCA_CDCA18G4556 [Cyanidium caldarium]|uniref:CRAL-TRIO domain-containing protein n=1 Tax=Cyanidium caldarium TaxID=2771 RepID=A0AAV9J293_CYACA|nr:hypothetical protein CDCA_CDCA18G4556 [Cyanidium caldarium]
MLGGRSSSERSFDATRSRLSLDASRTPTTTTTAEEQALIEQLRALLASEGRLADAAVASWATDRCLRRYVRARDHHLGRAHDMICKSIEWRLRVHPEQVVCEACARNPRSHNFRRVGRALNGEPVMFSTFAGVEDYVPAHNIEHLLSHIEEAVGVRARWPDRDPFPESYIWVIDFAGFSMRHLHPGVGRASLAMFSDHYPERLRLAVLVRAPLLFRGLWATLKPFIDKRTCKKIVFVRESHAPTLFDQIFPTVLTEWLVRELRQVRDRQRVKLKDVWSEWSPAWDDDQQDWRRWYPGETSLVDAPRLSHDGAICLPLRHGRCSTDQEAREDTFHDACGVPCSSAVT